MKNQILFIIGLTSVILLFFDSCGKEYTVESPSDSAVTITLNKSNISCVLGETEQTIYLDAVVKRGKKQIGNNWDITWSSSNTSVATVDNGYYGTVKIINSGNATITASAYGKSATCKITVFQHGYVDLGLSVKWATCNVGASRPEEFGDYYAWGEITTKESYSWEKYRFRKSGSVHDDLKFSKYNTSSARGTVDNRTQLELGDDVSYVIWGDNWRMPTVYELNELIENCIWIWTTQNGINGYKIKSNVSGYTNQSIFLPAAGYYYNKYYKECGWYWTSSLYTYADPDDDWSIVASYLLDLSDASYSRKVGYRRCGGSIRPVCP